MTSRRFFLPALFLALAACAPAPPASTGAPSYLFVWAGAADAKASDFLGGIDASPSSSSYGSILTSVETAPGIWIPRPHAWRRSTLSRWRRGSSRA